MSTPRNLLKFHSISALCLFSVLLSACSSGVDESDLSPSAQVQAGVEYLRVFNFDSAYSALSAIQPKLEEGTSDWTLATYTLALAAWHKSPSSNDALAQAKSLMQQVVEQKRGSDYAASALLDLGRMAEVADFLGDPTDVPAAQAYYQQVIEEFPRTQMSARATVFLAQSMAQSFNSESVHDAINLLEAEIAGQPDSPWIGTMSQYLSQLYAFYLHDPKASLEPYEHAMEVGFPRSADSDVSLWQYGLLAQEAGEDLIAARVFSRLVTNYPRSIYGTVARERVIQIAKAHPDADVQIPELRGLSIGR